MAQSFGINDFLGENQDFLTIQFDIQNQLTFHTIIDGTGILGKNDDNDTTFRTGLSASTDQNQQTN